MKRKTMLFILLCICGAFISGVLLRNKLITKTIHQSMEDLQVKILSVELHTMDSDELESYMSELSRRGMLSQEEAAIHRKYLSRYRMVVINLEFENKTGFDISNARRLDVSSPISRLIKLNKNGGNLKPFDKHCAFRFAIDPSGLSETDLRATIAQSKVAVYWAKGPRHLDAEIGFLDPPDEVFLRKKGIRKKIIEAGDVSVTIHN